MRQKMIVMLAGLAVLVTGVLALAAGTVTVPTIMHPVTKQGDMRDYLLAGFGAGDGIKYTTPMSAVTQYGITWTFDKNYEVGQFANGDYYVVDPGSGVTLTRVENDTHAGLDLSTVDYDGTQIDCHRTIMGPTPQQGLSSLYSSSGYYDSALNVNHHLPYTVTKDKTILSAITWLDTDPGHPTNHRPELKRIAVLTVVGTDVGPTAMRPSYAVGQKEIYRSTDIDESVFASLAAVPNTRSVAECVAHTQGPWTDLWDDWSSERFRAKDNYGMTAQNNSTYGARIVEQLVDALFVANISEADVGDKTQLIVNLVQIGIDYYGLYRNGAMWGANGGHHFGYKLPILVAGLALGDSDMLAVGADNINNNRFQEDCQHFYVEPSDWGRTVTPPRETYNSTDHPAGLPEWGIRHCAYPNQDDSRWTASYRSTVGPPDAGQALAILIMGLKTQWMQESYFDYADRYMSVSGPGSGFRDNMWNAYRSDYP